MSPNWGNDSSRGELTKVTLATLGDAVEFGSNLSGLEPGGSESLGAKFQSYERGLFGL